MNPDDKLIIEDRMERARQAFEAARELKGKGFSVSVINRLYYACFYSVNALILTGGYSSSKHSGVKSLFNQHYVKEGIIDKKWGKFYSNLFLKRQESDYRDFFECPAEEEDEVFRESVEFIQEINRIIINILEK